MADKRHLALVHDRRFQTAVESRRHIPAFAVDHGFRLDAAGRIADRIHRCDIDDAHQIETESVDTVKLHHFADHMQKICSSHRCIRGKVIAAIGAVGIMSGVVVAEVIIRDCLLKRRSFHIVYMVEDNIQIHPQVVPVHRADQFPELLHPCIRIVRIRAVASFRHQIMRRVIAPVIDFLGMIFVDCRKIEHRQKLHMRNAQGVDIVQTRRCVFIFCPLFRKCCECAVGIRAGQRRSRDIAHACFIDDGIGAGRLFIQRIIADLQDLVFIDHGAFFAVGC